MPISASPASFMTALRSFKSMLIWPDVVMTSEMDLMDRSSTSSASLNAASVVVLWSAISRSRWFGITSRVSTLLRISWMPCSAIVARLSFSKSNGRVTTPIVSAPISLAMRATVGAPPVPVPPPMPAVTKTRSAPRRYSRICSSVSAIASLPRLGSPPTPRPLMTLWPTWIFTSASERRRSCASVFAAMSSTPCTPASAIRLMALPPAPPMPITLMTARVSA